MKFKLFGRQIFGFSFSKGNTLMSQASSHLDESKVLPDFHELSGGSSDSFSPFVTFDSPATSTSVMTSTGFTPVSSKPKKKKPGRKPITPKGVFELNLLNNKSFKMKTDPKYLDKRIEEFKDKLDMIKLSTHDMDRGTIEIASILMRLKNRRKYGEFNDFYKNYAYTTESKVDKVINKHKHLKIGKVEQFIADLPSEAIKEMKAYTATTKKLCDKKPVFYIIADKKDFEKTKKRRDPILLAQSPFAHVWQILGAWDEEMIFLEEL